MSSGLHRRNSSAALYQPLTPQVGGRGDITDELESYSSATPQLRRGSLAAQQRALEELEEKEGFIPETAYDLPGQGGRRGGRKSAGGSWLGWKSRLVLTMLAGGAIGAGVYYVFYRDSGLWWDAPTSQEEIADWAKTAATSGAKGAATGVANYAYSGSKSVEDEVDEESDFYADEFSSSTSSPPSSKSASKTASAAKSSATAARTSFVDGTSEDVARLLENGTLSAYRWHEILPSLNGTSSTTIKKQDSGRLIIVGDIHGTQTSLRRLLRRLSFSSSTDTLLHTGDVLAKSSLSDSLATVSLLRKLGVKGVRGNHDQKVLEWRKWMEAYGPLDSATNSSSSLKGIQDAVAAAGSKAQTGFRAAGGAVKDTTKSGFRKVDKAASGQAAKLDASAPRSKKEKRGWLDWLTGNEAAGDSGVEELYEEASSYGAAVDDSSAGGKSAQPAWADEDEMDEGPGWDDLKLASEAASSSSASSSRGKSLASASPTSTGGGHRKPFGRPTSLSSASSPSSSSRTRTSSSITSTARPSSTSSSRLSSFASSLASNTSSTTLLGASYAWLSPSTTAAQLEKLGVEVPEGWEWGGDHFEIARHLEQEDVEYLEALPLTLWVEEIKSWVVHAGMVPWTSLSTTLSASSASSSAPSLPALLTSTSPLSFSPSTSLSKLLSSSPLTALLLEPLNADPYTLQNMRTLHGHAASADPASAAAKGRVKGPAKSWQVSSKGRKAGAGSRPWWSVWEEGMGRCAKKEGEGCETAGIVYGHWAGQGLQVQEHSIGLDTGCVYGRRLSALVVPLSSSSNATSPLSTPASSSVSSSSYRVLDSTSTDKLKDASYAGLHKLKGAASSLVSESLSSASASSASSTSEAEATTTSRAKAKWNGGLHKVTKSASSALSSATATRSSSASFSASSPASDDLEATATETAKPKPWWRPWSAASKEKVKKVKRAPPQGRPGTALWEDRDDEDEMPAYGGEEYEEWEGQVVEEEEEDDVDEEEVEKTTSTARKGRPTKTKTSAVSSTASSVKSHLSGSASSASLAAASATGKAASFASASFAHLDSLLSPSSGDEEEADELDESAFAEKVVYLAQTAAKSTGKGGKKDRWVKAWVVSVECLGEGSSAE